MQKEILWIIGLADKVHREEGKDQHRGSKDVLGLELKKPFMRIHTQSVFAVQRSTKKANLYFQLFVCLLCFE